MTCVFRDRRRPPGLSDMQGLYVELPGESRKLSNYLRAYVLGLDQCTLLRYVPNMFQRHTFDVDGLDRFFVGCVSVLHMEPSFLPVDIEHNEDPCPPSRLQRDFISVPTTQGSKVDAAIPCHRARFDRDTYTL